MNEFRKIALTREVANPIGGPKKTPAGIKMSFLASPVSCNRLAPAAHNGVSKKNAKTNFMPQAKAKNIGTIIQVIVTAKPTPSEKNYQNSDRELRPENLKDLAMQYFMAWMGPDMDPMCTSQKTLSVYVVPDTDGAELGPLYCSFKIKQDFRRD
jgi:hypothetical protein